MMKNEKVGVKEAAKILGLSKKSVYTKLRSGKLKGEKINTKFGQKWVIDKEQLTDQAKTKNEVVEVKEINELVDSKDFMNELIEAVNSQNKALINGAVENITEEIKSQSDKIDSQESKMERQDQAIRELTEEVKKLRKQQNKSIIDKIKDIFT